jgi:SpoVK/Ycf46/Vps4 family AAA+-type ATPase
MTSSELNLKNIKHFLNPIEKIDDVKKLNIYKELGVSPISYFILRYMFNKFVITGHRAIIVSDLIQTLSNSAFFKEIIDDKELEELGILELYKNTEKEISEEEYANFQNYNEIDYFEEDFKDIGFIKYISAIKELIEFGYIQNGSLQILDKNIYQLFTDELSLTYDILEIINNGKLEIQEYKNKKEYRNYEEYIKDIFKYIKEKHDYMILSKRLNKKSPILKKKKEESENLKKQIDVRLSKSKKMENPLEEFFKENKLTEEQKLIIMTLLRAEMSTDGEVYIIEENLLALFYEEVPEFLPAPEEMFGLPKTIIEFDYNQNPFTTEYTVNYYLSDEVLEKIQPKKHSEEKTQGKEVALQEVQSFIKENADFEISKPDKKIEDMILSEETNDLIELLLKQLDDKVIEKLKEWGIKQDDNIKARILFSGKPGTGKTATALAIGNSLDKYVISFDCSKILSMYVGESEKNVKMIFDTYKKVQKKIGYHPILLLNEADQFLGKRAKGNISGADKMHNQMQNIFLEEIEKFEGILIATTNLVENLDEAFSRRFNHKIEFKIPDKEKRAKIWEKRLKKLPLEKGFNINELATFELSGGQIELVIENTAVSNAIKNINKFKTIDFINFIKKEIKSSFDTEGKKMGFFN